MREQIYYGIHEGDSSTTNVWDGQANDYTVKKL